MKIGKDKNVTGKMKRIVGASLLIGAMSSSLNAQSIFTGIRGPSRLQIDDRISYVDNESQSGIRSNSLINNFILKYWDGKDKGVFAFASLPYKKINSGETKNSGLGDISLGVGPRFEIQLGKDKIGLLTYLGTVLPTGDNKSKPPLGTGRHDYKAGLFGTFLTGSKKYEADFSLDYSLTEGREVSNDIGYGLVLGGRVNDNLRLVAGPLFNYKTEGKNNGDFTLSGRLNSRYTPSGTLGKKMHFELWYDKSLRNKGVSPPKRSSALTLVGRFNLYS